MVNWNGETLEQLEREVLKQACRKVGRPISQLAKTLGISRAALYRKLYQYEIDIEGDPIRRAIIEGEIDV